MTLIVPLTYELGFWVGMLTCAVIGLSALRIAAWIEGKRKNEADES